MARIKRLICDYAKSVRTRPNAARLEHLRRIYDELTRAERERAAQTAKRARRRHREADERLWLHVVHRKMQSAARAAHRRQQSSGPAARAGALTMSAARHRGPDPRQAVMTILTNT